MQDKKDLIVVKVVYGLTLFDDMAFYKIQTSFSQVYMLNEIRKTLKHC